MKFNKLVNKFKLSCALITATSVISGTIISVPLLLSTYNISNRIMSNNIDYQNTKIYVENDSNSIFAVVTKDDGYDVLYAWGHNSNGQLGLGTNTSQVYPKLVVGLPTKSKITHVASSLNATTIVIDGNQVWSSGNNDNHQFGNDSRTSTNNFVENKKWNGTMIKSLHVGTYHRVVVTDDAVWAWGLNNDGQLGKGDTSPQPIPVDITDNIIKANAGWMSGEFFASGYNTAMVIDGQLYMWGWNGLNQLGNNDTVSVLAPPLTPLAMASKIKKYSMSGSYSLALLDSGLLYGWGNNAFNQLGLLNTINKVATPQSIARDRDSNPFKEVITDVFTSSSSSYIRVGTQIYATGSNAFGILGQNDTATSIDGFAPIKLDVRTKIIDVMPSSETLMINQASGLFMTGSNEFGQFANGNANTNPNPVLNQVTFFGTPIKIKTKSDNKLYTADDIVSDLNNNKDSVQVIKTTLAKYIDGIDSLIGSTLKYSVPPIANHTKDKVIVKLITNSPYNVDGAKVGVEFDVLIEITNLNIPPNLGLIIGLSVSGAIILTISILAYIKYRVLSHPKLFLIS